MSNDEALIYTCIENAARHGLWVRAIKERTNLHQSIITRSLKSLEAHGHIKSILNVKQPTQKVYMVAALAPLDEMTGGPWYTAAGELDEDFVRCMAALADKYVWNRSFVVASEESGKNGKRAFADGETTRQSDRNLQEETDEKLLPHPPGYTGYPRVQDVTRYLNSIDASDVVLDDNAVETLMNVLCYDGKIERVLNGNTFRSVKTKGCGGIVGKYGRAQAAHRTEAGHVGEDAVPKSENKIPLAIREKYPDFDSVENGLIDPSVKFFEEWSRQR